MSNQENEKMLEYLFDQAFDALKELYPDMDEEDIAVIAAAEAQKEFQEKV